MVRLDWKPGDPIPCPFHEFETLDLSQMDVASIYKLLIGGVVPRPIAFVSTQNKKKEGNLAPFSYFNAVSSSPPCLVFSCAYQPDGTKKDTLINIEETGEFVVNTVNEWMVEAVNQCGARYPYGVNEMKKVGLTALPSKTILPPRVKESAIQFECKLYQLIPVGDPAPGASTLVVGKILTAHLAKEVFERGKIPLQKLKPISRLGGRSYGKTTETFELPRATP